MLENLVPKDIDFSAFMPKESVLDNAATKTSVQEVVDQLLGKIKETLTGTDPKATHALSVYTDVSQVLHTLSKV